MKNFCTILFIIFPFSLFSQTETYPEDSASIEQPNVPKGELLKFTFENSKIFPGTWREVWVQVPAQYRSNKPACVYINQDGIQWKASAVFPNAMRWLWKNYPEKITATAQNKNQFLKDILLENEGQKLVGEDYGFTEGTVANEKGEVSFKIFLNQLPIKLYLTRSHRDYNLFYFRGKKCPK